MLTFICNRLPKFFFLLLTVLVASCSGSGSGGGSNPNPPPVVVTLKAITLTPAGGSGLAIGGTLQLTAVASYTDQSTKDVTSSVVWSSSTPSVATITAGGLATGVAPGTTNITAVYQGVTSAPVSLSIGEAVISASTKLPYSTQLSQLNTAVFLVQNLTSNPLALSAVTPTVNGGGTAVINAGQTTCGASLGALASCNYAVDYTAPAAISASGALADLVLQVTTGASTVIQASTTTFIANGATNLQGSGLVPTKVVMIYNSDPTHTIYPVVETSRKLAPNFDSWLMSFFGTPGNPTSAIYTSGVYRIYIGGSAGIAPGQYAALPFPLYSQFTSTQSNGDLYVDWWRGTRFYIYDNPVAVQLHMGKDDTQINNSQLVASLPNTKICNTVIFNQLSCQDVASLVYQDKIDSAFPANDPAQLVEPSLGSDSGIGSYVWDGTQIDYDVSYVNDLYLPLSLGKIDSTDPTLGWVGTNASIGSFQQKAQAAPFMSLSATQGAWPIFVYSTAIQAIVDQSPAKGQVHIPSAIQTLPNPYAPMGLNQISPNGFNFVYNRLLATDQWMITNNSSPLAYVGGIIGAWEAGIDNNDANVITIWNAFKANYAANCPSSPQPVSLAYAIPNMVGFASFGECADGKPALGQPLPNAGTPQGLALIKAFHTSMNNPQQTLNPWVSFIHAQLGLQSVYAYSIDDALGNVQTSGDGFLIEVGGSAAQQNPAMMQPGRETVLLSFGGLPLNAYAYTNLSLCGKAVTGTTPFTKNSVSGNGIIAANFPIYLATASGGNQCAVTIQGVTLLPVSISGTTYPIGTSVNAAFTVANVNASGGATGATALTNSMKASCTDNIGGLYCSGLNASSTSDAVLYTVAWPG